MVEAVARTCEREFSIRLMSDLFSTKPSISFSSADFLGGEAMGDILFATFLDDTLL